MSPKDRKRRTAIIAKLAELSRDGWRHAATSDYLPLEKELREIDDKRSPIFASHRCWRCNDGAKPCPEGGPHRCSYPRALND